MGCLCRMFREAGLEHCFRSFGFELQGRCSAVASWRARKRDPKTFSLAAQFEEVEGRVCIPTPPLFLRL